ncbi:unnamed protein product, partial [Iphiclides podalirius]
MLVTYYLAGESTVRAARSRLRGRHSRGGPVPAGDGGRAFSKKEAPAAADIRGRNPIGGQSRGALSPVRDAPALFGEQVRASNPASHPPKLAAFYAPSGAWHCTLGLRCAIVSGCGSMTLNDYRLAR